MKIRMKAIDLMLFLQDDFRISKNLRSKTLDKYGIDPDKMKVIKKALVDNHWKIL